MLAHPARFGIVERGRPLVLRNGVGDEMLVTARARRALGQDRRAAGGFGIGRRDEVLGGVGRAVIQSPKSYHGTQECDTYTHSAAAYFPQQPTMTTSY